AKDYGIAVFCHIDLIQGIGKDPAGIDWLADEIGISGILTTRSNLIRAAKASGLIAIQRLFLLDSESLKTAIDIVSSSRPDAVEILPALVLPSLIHRLPVRKLSPFIAGGLVETVPELEAVVSTGALGVSTSKQELWKFAKALPDR
ncbi:MAG TPA: glycerol-3-phosphate responsive antiterminator, partial [Firmicutes bacterium]|nr:glycerol-3-phosphate responsive antiterminator [Bacillota bacterium]